MRWGGALVDVFMAQGAALVVYGLVIAGTIAGGAWFGSVGWPGGTAASMRRIQSG